MSATPHPSPSPLLLISGSGWWTLPQHVGNDEEPHVAAADVDLLEMADAPVARRDGDVLELHVHVVLGCFPPPPVLLSAGVHLFFQEVWEVRGLWSVRTFDQLAAVGLAGGDLEGDDVALCGCASLV